MNRRWTFAALFVVFLAGVSAAHVRLAHGGIDTFILKIKNRGVPQRGDLIVGYLPVT